MNERNYSYFPDKEHRFFLCDQYHGEHFYFKTIADRDAYAENLIQSFLDDGWCEGVDQIIAGEVTHHTVMCDVKLCPKREDYDSDDDYEYELSEYGDPIYPYSCGYELAPLEEEGEKPPKIEGQP